MSYLTVIAVAGVLAAPGAFAAETVVVLETHPLAGSTTIKADRAAAQKDSKPSIRFAAHAHINAQGAFEYGCTEDHSGRRDSQSPPATHEER